MIATLYVFAFALMVIGFIIESKSKDHKTGTILGFIGMGLLIVLHVGIQS